MIELEARFAYVPVCLWGIVPGFKHKTYLLTEFQMKISNWTVVRWNTMDCVVNFKIVLPRGGISMHIVLRIRKLIHRFGQGQKKDYHKWSLGQVIIRLIQSLLKTVTSEINCQNGCQFSLSIKLSKAPFSASISLKSFFIKII